MKMKKILALLTALFILTTMLVVPASAAELTVNYTYASEVLTINGTGATAGSLVSVFILRSTDSADAVSASNLPAVIDVTMADASGNFNLVINLPANLTTGQYKVNVASGATKKDSTVFIHINSGELEALLGNVNGSATSGEIEGFLTPLNVALELPDITYTSEYLFAVRPAAPGFTESQFQSEMQRSVALYMLQNGATPEELEDYEDYLKDATLDIDCLAQYTDMDAAVKASYLTAVAGLDLKTTSALADVYGAGMMEEVKSVTTWKGLENVVRGETAETTYFKNVIAAGTDYDSLINPEVVFQNLYGKLSDLTDLSALKSNFASLVTVAYEAELAEKVEDEEEDDNRGGYTGGFGGGISSWGPSASETVNQFEEANKTEPDYNEGANQGSAARFNDISGHWAEKAISEMAAIGAASGYEDGSFCPDKTVTRGEFVKLLCELFDVALADNHGFGDVSADAWYASYANAAAAAGIVGGDSEGNFNANAPVTRQDAATMLGRFLKLTEGSVDGKFNDADSMAPYAAGYIAAMVDAGLLNGMGDGSFAPVSDTTRAQAVTMLLNARTWLSNHTNGGVAE